MLCFNDTHDAYLYADHADDGDDPDEEDIEAYCGFKCFLKQ